MNTFDTHSTQCRHNLMDTLLYLDANQSIRSYAKQFEFFRKAQQDSELADSFTLVLFEVQSAEDVHYPIWEMHPEGDELLILISGSLSIEFDDQAITQEMLLLPQTAFVVPAGSWHRIEVNEPSMLLAVTPRHGTLHKSF